jgi:hypothetical protein
MDFLCFQRGSHRAVASFHFSIFVAGTCHSLNCGAGREPQHNSELRRLTGLFGGVAIRLDTHRLVQLENSSAGVTKKLSIIPSAAACRAFQRRTARANKLHELQIRLRDTLRDIAMVVKEEWVAELKAARKAGNQKRIKCAEKHIANIDFQWKWSYARATR